MIAKPDTIFYLYYLLSVYPTLSFMDNCSIENGGDIISSKLLLDQTKSSCQKSLSLQQELTDTEDTNYSLQSGAKR